MTKRSMIINAFVAGAMGFSVSFLLHLLVIPFPTSSFGNTLNNGLSGLFSGFIGVLITLVILNKKNTHL